MPSSLNLEQSFKVLDLYQFITDGVIELHYSMMKGINDSSNDLVRLLACVDKYNFIVKLLYYNEKDSSDVRASMQTQIDYFLRNIKEFTEVKYYVPPGLDIGSSCGQFLMDHYTKLENK